MTRHCNNPRSPAPPISRSRRSFLRAALAAAAVPAPCPAAPAAPAAPATSSWRPAFGMFLAPGPDLASSLKIVRDLGLTCCSLLLEDATPVLADHLRAALDKHNLTCTAVFTSGPGPRVYDFYQGPRTLGLVPREWRRRRLDALKRSSDLCRRAGVAALETHVGFIPEDPADPLYGEVVDALREIARHCQANRQVLLYHAGEQTPTTMLRALRDVGTDNQGIGLDTANLILYGKGHPLYALDVLGTHVRLVNAKDGVYPTGVKELGRETPLGEGRVDFPRLLPRLSEVGYRGPIIIERETSGPRQHEDIRQARAYLEKLLSV